MRADKPLGRKNYGHIPHLPGSRTGPGDHMCHEGQARIATVRVRDKYDTVILQEKLDGSCCGVARINGGLFPLGRAGYLASSSPYIQHRYFATWVHKNYDRFISVLRDGERLVGEWLLQAHGTRYELWHEPFVAFDIMTGSTRLPYGQFSERIHKGYFATPYILHMGDAISIEEALKILGDHGFHGAIDKAEGAVWRVERNKLKDRHSDKREQVVDFLVKYVRPDKVDGIYLNREDKGIVWNCDPKLL